MATNTVTDAVMAELVAAGFTTGSITDRERARLLALSTHPNKARMSLLDLYRNTGQSPRLAGGKFGAVPPAVLNPALSLFRAARANVLTTPCRVLTWGDSYMEGQGASTRANTWVSKLRDLLDAAAGTGSVGAFHQAPYYTVFSPDSPWFFEGIPAFSGTMDQRDYPSGLGNHSLEVRDASSVTFSVTGVAADILFYNYGGTMSVQVDGGSTVVHTPSTSDFNVYPVVLGGTATTTHTIKLTFSTGASSYLLHGLIVYKNTKNASGFYFNNGGRSGTTTTSYTTNTGDMDIRDGVWKAIAPDLMIFSIGGNDYLNDTATPAQAAANVQTILTRVKAYPKVPSIVWMKPQAGLRKSGEVAGKTYENYVDAIGSVVTSNGGTIINYGDVLGTPPGNGYASDNLHFLDAKHAEVANLVFSKLGA